METIVTAAVPALIALIAVRLLAVPVKFLLKLIAHAACGFLCLWLLSTVSGFTGLSFPINAVTVLFAGFFGIPGIGLIALLELL